MRILLVWENEASLNKKRIDRKREKKTENVKRKQGEKRNERAKETKMERKQGRKKNEGKR